MDKQWFEFVPYVQDMNHVLCMDMCPFSHFLFSRWTCALSNRWTMRAHVQQWTCALYNQLGLKGTCPLIGHVPIYSKLFFIKLRLVPFCYWFDKTWHSIRRRQFLKICFLITGGLGSFDQRWTLPCWIRIPKKAKSAKIGHVPFCY